MQTANAKEWIRRTETQIKKEFDINRRILSFDEYLQVFLQKPDQQLRSSAETLLAACDYFGKEAHSLAGSKAKDVFRYHAFDGSEEDPTLKVVGQEKVQTQIYRSLTSFSRQKINNRLVLLHGPNGSAKSTLVRSLMHALERFSRLPEGATYTFNWVFPAEKIIKKSMGLQTYAESPHVTEGFAKLNDEDIAARFPCDLRDHPFLLIPTDLRRTFLVDLLGDEEGDRLYNNLSYYLVRGDLCHRCRQIFDALLASNGGDYSKVLMHIQVERLYFSRRYRKGLVTIEPQLHVDAQYNQLTYNKSLAMLPASLQGLNLFHLSGDLIDGNRGIVEFSDLLKRPVDSFKYLLGVCETGAVNVGHAIAHLDTVMIGSCNELQLDSFKEFPDFGSFKARMELVRVPYLLSVSEEREIYTLQLKNLTHEKHVSPHVAHVLASWAILTRLKKPNSIHYAPNVSALIAGLTPIDKAKVYDNGELPGHYTPDSRKLLRANLEKLRNEYEAIPFYEGRTGASVREMKTILYSAAQNPDFACISPLAIFVEIEMFMKRVNEYDFLKQDIKEGFHDHVEFLNIVKKEYLDTIDREARQSIGLYDVNQWEEFLHRFVIHLSHLLKKEKVHNAMTGKSEDPDLSLIKEFERIVDAPKDEKQLQAFRNGIISQVGAWSLDNPGKAVIYADVFPEYWAKLEKHYYESQKKELTKMHNALQLYGTDQFNRNEEGSRLASQTIDNMKKKLGYCENCAKEVIGFLMQKRY